MNSLHIIRPYKFENCWVFDDEAKGLAKEPFVGGSDTIIDVVTANIPDADKGFTAIFSDAEFPGAQIRLKWVGEQGTGNVYRWPEKELMGWLCPALLKYFVTAPKELYVQVKP